MKLEDEIKQTRPFPDARRKAVVNIAFTANVIACDIRNALKPFDINDQHFNVLRILRGRHPNSACPGEIRDVLLDKRGDLTRLLDKLEQKKWIVRWTNPENRRSVNVQITESGLTAVARMYHDITKAEKFVENISHDEANTLNLLLDKLRG